MAGHVWRLDQLCGVLRVVLERLESEFLVESWRGIGNPSSVDVSSVFVELFSDPRNLKWQLWVNGEEFECLWLGPEDVADLFKFKIGDPDFLDLVVGCLGSGH